MGVADILTNQNIDTAGTEEEAADGLEAALGMEMEEDRGSEGEEGGEGTLRLLGALEFLTQDAEPIITTLVDARNGFNELSRLAMVWTVRHRWPAGARFSFNFYRHWTQLILRHPGELPVIILNRDGLTQGDPLSVVMYGITLVPLTKELRAVDPGLLSSFNADDAAFYGFSGRSAQLLKVLMKRGPDRGYFPNLDRSLFISDTPGQEGVAKR